MHIVTILDPEVNLRKLEARLGPEPQWFDGHVIRALRDLGHEVSVVQHRQDIRSTIDDLDTTKPDLVFNLAQHANGLETWCGHIPALLDLLGLPYTGAGPVSHALSGSKATAKLILAGAGIKIPQFLVVPLGAAVPRAQLRFPVIVKLLWSGGSLGLSKASVCQDPKSLEQRVLWLHRRYEADVICEEFIEGQEVSVTLLGNKRLYTLPLFEATFRRGSRATRILTERVKWNPTYRRRSGVRYRVAKMDDVLRRRVVQVAKKTYRILEFRDYGNVDMRVTSQGAIYFIDGNANPGLAPISPVVQAPPFNAQIAGIIRSAMRRAQG